MGTLQRASLLQSSTRFGYRAREMTIANMVTPRIAILISGRGSNMLALLEAIEAGRLNAKAAVVISNVESAPGLEAASKQGVETLVLSHKEKTREEHDRQVIAELNTRDVSLVCLAGYMRLVSAEFLRAFHHRVLNIHPSLLPAFPGLNAQEQALRHGVKITGCTVHIVDEELDRGPIVLQRAVPVNDSDTVESLSARILEQEHIAYPEAVRIVLSEGFVVDGRRTRVANQS